MKGKGTETIDAIARDCIALRVRILSRVITNLYDEVLRPLGLKASQHNVLVAAAKLGRAQPTKICEILQMDASTLSRNVDRMLAKGWLEVVPAEDARRQPIRLTAQGAKLLERAAPAWERAQQRAMDLLGPEGMATLAKTTSKIASSLRA